MVIVHNNHNTPHTSMIEIHVITDQSLGSQEKMPLSNQIISQVITSTCQWLISIIIYIDANDQLMNDFVCTAKQYYSYKSHSQLSAESSTYINIHEYVHRVQANEII